MIRKLTLFANLGAALSLACMIGVVLVQVFARSFLVNAPAWTEEASRIAFLYLVAFGIGPAVRSNKLVRLELLSAIIRPSINKPLQLCIQSINTLFAFVLTYLSYSFVASGAYERSPALGIQMSFLFASLLLLSGSLLLFSAASLAREAKS